MSEIMKRKEYKRGVVKNLIIGHLFESTKLSLYWCPRLRKVVTDFHNSFTFGLSSNNKVSTKDHIVPSTCRYITW